VAAVFHIMNHATFKASLFMAAGIVDHESGTRDIRRLSGLRFMMPITATLACVASAAMAGVPLLNGFISKEMFFAETVYLDAAPGSRLCCRWLRPWRACSAWPIRCALRSMSSLAPANDLPHEPHEPPHWMRVPVELLVLACLIVGIFPAWAVGGFLAVAAPW
jgi:multicomponent K+:H+ antiporter subunit A